MRSGCDTDADHRPRFGPITELDENDRRAGIRPHGRGRPESPPSTRTRRTNIFSDFKPCCDADHGVEINLRKLERPRSSRKRRFALPNEFPSTDVRYPREAGPTQGKVLRACEVRRREIAPQLQQRQLFSDRSGNAEAAHATHRARLVAGSSVLVGGEAEYIGSAAHFMFEARYLSDYRILSITSVEFTPDRTSPDRSTIRNYRDHFAAASAIDAPSRAPAAKAAQQAITHAATASGRPEANPSAAAR